MFKSLKGVLTALAITTLLTMTAAVSYGQTTGSVTMNATVSNFVELTSGGLATATGAATKKAETAAQAARCVRRISPPDFRISDPPEAAPLARGP